MMRHLLLLHPHVEKNLKQQNKSSSSETVSKDPTPAYHKIPQIPVFLSFFVFFLSPSCQNSAPDQDKFQRYLHWIGKAVWTSDCTLSQHTLVRHSLRDGWFSRSHLYLCKNNSNFQSNHKSSRKYIQI